MAMESSRHNCRRRCRRRRSVATERAARFMTWRTGTRRQLAAPLESSEYSACALAASPFHATAPAGFSVSTAAANAAGVAGRQFRLIDAQSSSEPDNETWIALLRVGMSNSRLGRQDGHLDIRPR